MFSYSIIVCLIVQVVLHSWIFDFHITCAFVYYKFSSLICLLYAEFRLPCTFDEQTFRAIIQRCCRANSAKTAWSWQRNYLFWTTSWCCWRYIFCVLNNAAIVLWCRHMEIFLIVIKLTNGLWSMNFSGHPQHSPRSVEGDSPCYGGNANSCLWLN